MKRILSPLIEKPRLSRGEDAKHLARGLGVSSTLLAMAAVILAQYTPPPDPPPGRQTSFVESFQEVGCTQQANFLA
jgi:hypothetical protein